MIFSLTGSIVIYQNYKPFIFVTVAKNLWKKSCQTRVLGDINSQKVSFFCWSKYYLSQSTRGYISKPLSQTFGYIWYFVHCMAQKEHVYKILSLKHSYLYNEAKNVFPALLNLRDCFPLCKNHFITSKCWTVNKKRTRRWFWFRTNPFFWQTFEKERKVRPCVC